MAHIISVFKIRDVKIDFLLSLILSLIIYLILKNGVLPCIVSDTISVICTISATLLGFLITAYALLLAFPKGGNMNLISQHPTYPSIFDCFMLTIYVHALLLITSLFGLLMDIHICNVFSEFYYYILIFFICYSLVTLMRCLYLLYNLTRTVFNSN